MSSSHRPHQVSFNYEPPKHAMTRSVNYAPLAPSHLYEAEDPLQSYVRSRPIEKIKNPKPILSQTGSPIMPGGTPNMSSRVQMKRFRPASTLPMFSSPSKAGYNSFYDDSSFSPTSPNQFAYSQPPAPQSYAPVNTHSQPLVYPYSNSSLNSVPVPFNERKMASQLQHSVNRAAANKFNPPSHAYHPQPTPVYHSQPTAYPFSPSSIQHSQQPDAYSQPWKDSLRKPDYDLHQPVSPSFRIGGANTVASPKSPKVVNLQYNTPIGLYSKENIREELQKQIGNANLPFVPSSEF